jgi:SAM-dependent methyltransferase
MKKTIADHASRFDEKAAEYDDEKSEEYRACANLAIEGAAPTSRDTVLDLGAGTGAIGLALAPEAGEVVLRDISEGMLDQARRKADERGLENVSAGTGRFRDPDVEPYRTGDGSEFDVVVSNFAMHHLDDEEKREAIEVVAELDPRRLVLGDVTFFDAPDPEEPFYSPEVDDPSTVGHLADLITDHWTLSRVERVHDQVGVLVAERRDDGR